MIRRLAASSWPRLAAPTVRLVSNLTSTPFKIQEEKVAAPWGHVSFQVFGEVRADHQPILATHGFLDNSNSFKPLAFYLCNNGYYIVSVDLPGHGFSSKLPLGNPVTLQLILSACRRVVKHVQLKDFIFLTHSYGTLLSLMYATCFRNEVKALAILDWTFPDWHQDKNGPFSELIASVIDQPIDAEVKAAKEKAAKAGRPGPAVVVPPLTYESALAKLMQSNEHLNEEAAKTILERGITMKGGEIVFTRDKRIVQEFMYFDHFYEFRTMHDEIKSKIQSPVYSIYAWPPFRNSEKSFKYVNNFLQEIRERSKVHVQVEKFAHSTSHHFHMVKSKETAQLLMEFFAKHVNKKAI